MKILWLSTAVPQIISEKYQISISKPESWVDGLYNGLKNDSDIELTYLFSGRLSRKKINCFINKTHFISYPEKTLLYDKSLESFFFKMLSDIKPECIHIWGSESGRTLAMINASKKLNISDRVIIHIQGLSFFYSVHYTLGLPQNVINSFTFRDFIRRNNIKNAQKRFLNQGKYEIEAIKKVSQVIGRTDWDKACVKQINPHTKYYYCGEMLRPAFYTDRWGYNQCKKHTIFVAQNSYPVKGFHFMIRALTIIRRFYPDVLLITTGKNPLCGGYKDKLLQSSYQRYIANLIRSNHLESIIQYVGILNELQMKEQYLKTNVFVSCSTIENSPNSVGEAMLLGVPIVSSDVGGIKSLLIHNETALLYQSDAPYMLADCIMRMFEDVAFSKKCANNAYESGKKRYSRQLIVKDVKNIYSTICNK